MDDNGSQGDSYTGFSVEDPPSGSQQVGQSLDAVRNSSQTDPPPEVGNRRSIDAGTQTDPVEFSTQKEVDTGFSSSPIKTEKGKLVAIASPVTVARASFTLIRAQQPVRRIVHSPPD